MIAKRHLRKWLKAAAALGAFLAASAALGDPPVYITLENEYIGMAVGIAGHHHLG